jgi:predicted nucleic acid-binding protein
MVKALLDTNVLVDFLGGVPQARSEIDRYDDAAISIVTWMEVMIGAPPEAADATRSFLARFALVELDQDVAEKAVALRRQYRMKLPDAIIWASARRHGRLLVTRNIKDFPGADPGVRVPYKVRTGRGEN